MASGPARCPVGPGRSPRPAPPEDWSTIPVPAIIGQETYAAAPVRLVRTSQRARRNTTAHAYLRRGLVSGGQCQFSCRGRTVPPGYPDYVCRGRTEALRAARGDRCTARLAPARTLAALVWRALGRILTALARTPHERARSHDRR
jgi:hypothetical protein